MRIDRFAIAAAALVASTVLISCSSDDNSNPSNGSIGISDSIPSIETTPGALDTTAP